MFSRQSVNKTKLIYKQSLFLCDIYIAKWEKIFTRQLSKCALQDVYEKAKTTCTSKKLPQNVNPNGVFACNELNLREISVYGFDYDYTLGCYSRELENLIYNLGCNVLVNKFMYPKGIKSLEYLPDFTIRGLHYDIENGVLLKLDTFLQIQLGTVYRGLTPLSDEQVIDLYKNRTVPIAYVEGQGKSAGGSSKLYQLADLFSMPEMSLLSNITQFFQDQSIDYNPQILFQDVRNAISSIHPVMHKEVLENTQKYLNPNPNIRELLKRLVNAEKKTFLVTNSPYYFVNRGMNLVVGSDWKDLFDVIIVQARKPKFFTDESRPLRVCDTVSNSQLWDRVTKFEKGVIYCEGTIKQLQDMTGWTGDQVLYFGDHPYSDLADVTLQHGWRTGAIIHELTHEIDALNTETFKQDVNWLQVLTQLIEECEGQSEDAAAEDVMSQWTHERLQLMSRTKSFFNPQFGSVFRTHNNPSYFSKRLFRFADIYTSNITNLLQYSLKHTFFPRRGALPHEYASLFM